MASFFFLSNILKDIYYLNENINNYIFKKLNYYK